VRDTQIMEHEISSLYNPTLYADALSCLKEIQQGRSNFQLVYFVLGQHDTAEQQYKQVLLEIQNLSFTIREVTLELKKRKIKIEKLKTSTDEIDMIDAEIEELKLENTKLSLLGAENELNTLLELWSSFEKKYNKEDIEKNQADYWSKRLLRQAHLEKLGTGVVNWSSLDALLQINQLEGFVQQTTKELEE
jgi:hypothetical protein